MDRCQERWSAPTGTGADQMQLANRRRPGEHRVADTDSIRRRSASTGVYTSTEASRDAVESGEYEGVRREARQEEESISAFLPTAGGLFVCCEEDGHLREERPHPADQCETHQEAAFPRHAGGYGVKALSSLALVVPGTHRSANRAE